MKKEIIQETLSHLCKEGLLNESIPSTEDEFVKALYVNNDVRKEILKACMSLFSEDYKADLQRAPSIDNELAIKLHELDFITKEKRLHFVLGKCSKEEQEDVYKKMFRALHYLFIAKEHDCIMDPLPLLTENLTKQGTQLSGSKTKKHSKKQFNLEQANENLKMAKKTLTEASEFMRQYQFSCAKRSQSSCDKVESKEIEESQLSELASTANAFRLTMEKHVSLPLETSSDETTNAAELGSAVGELRPLLQYVVDATKQSSPGGMEVKKQFYLDKILKEAEKLENNSVLKKCFLRD